MMSTVYTPLKAYDPDFVIQWYDDDREGRPSGRIPHAEIGVYHTAGGQVTMGNKSTNRTFRRYGYLEVLVRTPEGDGLTLADELATIVHDALEGVTTPGGVIFRNVRGTEEGKSGSFRTTNVSADFEYDQIK